MSKSRARRIVALRNTGPIVSFTFDDFPKSALHVAGPILEEAGVSGTYYAAFGLRGQTGPTGEIFEDEDIGLLLERGHEMGCHTYSHRHAYETPPGVFEAEIERNRRVADPFGIRFETLSYPIGGPSPANKRVTARHFKACRAGGQTFNCGRVDLNALKSFFLEQACGDMEEVERVIRANASAGGWLIFSTHDVCDQPTRFGCTPDFFSRVVELALASGARPATISQGLREVGAG